MIKFRNSLVSVLVTMLLMLSVLPFNVYANGPTPSPELIVELQNLPKGTAYVDIAVRASEDEIVDLAQDPPEGVLDNSPLVRGEYGEFFSYSFRVRHAESTIVLDENNCVFFLDPERIHDYEQVRLVMADKNGEILKLSDVVRIVPCGLFAYSANMLKYDAVSGDLDILTGPKTGYFLLYLWMSVAGLVVTCIAEWLVGAALKLTKTYGYLILVTNVISQILMRVLFVILYTILPQYITLTLLLEILVYAGEFVVYRFRMKDISISKCLLYVLSANSASLVMGILLNLYMR